MFNYDHNWGFMGGGMWLFWLIFIIIIFLLIKTFNTPSNPPSEQNETALDILKKRYAKGEITKEEFEEQKKTLLS